MTLLETTVVIGVLLLLAALLFVGAVAWKRGSDRAVCLVNLGTVQQGVRAYANLYNHQPGEAVAGLERQLIGPGSFVESMPVCPGLGTYGTLGDQIPQYGVLYMACSLATTAQHQPQAATDW